MERRSTTPHRESDAPTPGFRRLPCRLSFPPLVDSSPQSGGNCAMRMLVLGAGLQGSACAYDLLQHPGVDRVTVADLKPDRVAGLLRPLAGRRLTHVKLDVQDGAALRAAMGGHDAVLNAAPYYFNLEVSKAAVDSGVHCADLGGNTEIVFQQRKLDAAARERGVSVIPDCGLAPGMVNILAAEGIRRVGEAEEVKIFVGGPSPPPQAPLKYPNDF